jgi:diadenosine tetraphosphate (Ap4A) HIT family hydrolase
VTPGHTLVIPTRHVPDWFEASPWEQAEIWRAVAEIKPQLDSEFQSQPNHGPKGSPLIR